MKKSQKIANLKAKNKELKQEITELVNNPNSSKSHVIKWRHKLIRQTEDAMFLGITKYLKF